ncbi:MAG: toll/interleukin-1 receptor domain-containing protein [Oscillospiraceae bacterium]|nr:toll/interleukin-1 receptor domain-containing protein [Oscillospiraceae bacterium]
MVYEDKRLAAYHGQEPYLFLSYSHRDAEEAAEMILRLKQAGFRVWYDEGVIPATEWDENIARAIGNCAFFVSLISEAYLASSNCLDELNYARDLEKPQLLIYLEDVSLPDGLAMRLGRLLAIYKDRFDDPENFYSRVFRAKGIKVCRGEAWLQADEESEEIETTGSAIVSPTSHTGCLVALLAAVILLAAVLLGWHYREQIRDLFSGSSYSQQSAMTPQPVPDTTPTPDIAPADTDTSADIITTEAPVQSESPVEAAPTPTVTPVQTPTPTVTPVPPSVSPSAEVVNPVIVSPSSTEIDMGSVTPSPSDAGMTDIGIPDLSGSTSTETAPEDAFSAAGESTPAAESTPAPTPIPVVVEGNAA